MGLKTQFLPYEVKLRKYVGKHIVCAQLLLVDIEHFSRSLFMPSYFTFLDRKLSNKLYLHGKTVIKIDEFIKGKL